MALFCREFNEKTQKLESGKIVSVEITVLKNSYQFRLKGRVSSDLIKETIGEKKEITPSELEKIAQEKLIYLNTDDLEQAKKIIAGTAQSEQTKLPNDFHQENFSAILTNRMVITGKAILKTTEPPWENPRRKMCEDGIPFAISAAINCSRATTESSRPHSSSPSINWLHKSSPSSWTAVSHNWAIPPKPWRQKITIWLDMRLSWLERSTEARKVGKRLGKKVTQAQLAEEINAFLETIEENLVAVKPNLRKPGESITVPAQRRVKLRVSDDDLKRAQNLSELEKIYKTLSRQEVYKNNKKHIDRVYSSCETGFVGCGKKEKLTLSFRLEIFQLECG
ncbi:7311_t:CDS:2, partial [Racocetra persica]